MNDGAHFLTATKSGDTLADTAPNGFLAYSSQGGDGTVTDLTTLEADASACPVSYTHLTLPTILLV